MKQFDSASIYARSLADLSDNPNWKAIASDSVLAATLQACAERDAEIARYAEYLFGETRWDTARNLSSVAAAAGQLGYKPARKKSAAGELYISADPALHLIGRRIFKDDFLNGYISNWGTLSAEINFNTDVTITDTAGNSYILTSTDPLKPGTAYVRNSIIQGVKKSVVMPVDVARSVATRSKLDPYLYIPISIENCEDGSSAATASFFRVFVHYQTSTVEYRVVDALHLSQSEDKDVEVYADLYSSDLLYLKFNTSSQRGKPLSLSEGSGIVSIEVQYVESKGNSGNLTKVFEPFTITGLPDYPDIVLYGINFDSITGGADEENAHDIKTQAPLYYMTTYTAGTKEAYENLIKRIDFGNKRYASKVHVFPGSVEDTESGLLRNVTYVTLLMASLEDMVNSTDDNPYVSIERMLNLYLSRLKAPTDVLKFVPPSYIGFSIGVSLTALRSEVDNITTLRNNIRNMLDSYYGARSAELDFGRKLYEADIVSLIKQENPAVKSIKTELEAVQKLNWNTVTRMHPVSEVPVHTVRMNFDFNPVFKGNMFIKGFRDYRTGASYVLRVDVMYRQALTSALPAYHTSIFVGEDLTRELPAFYAIKDNTDTTPIWGPGYAEADYPMDNTDYAHLQDVYQFYYKKRLYDDDDFSSATSAEALRQEAVLTDYTKTPGCLDSFLISFTGDYDAEDGKIGEGFFEFDVTAMYGTLQKYAEQDPHLRTLLYQYPLANVKCDSATTMFNGFVRDVLSNYVDIYVSMRPVDKDLVPDETDQAQNSIVLYVDSADDDSTSAVMTNLTLDKKERLLSVECELI